jgi:hypothetical protein
MRLPTYLGRLVEQRCYTLIAVEIESRFGVLPPAAVVAWWFHPLRVMEAGHASWSDQTWFMWFKQRLAADGLWHEPGRGSEAIRSNWPAVRLTVGYLRLTTTAEQRKRLAREFEPHPRPPRMKLPAGRHVKRKGGAA